MHDKLSPLKIIMITLCVINMALFSSASRAQEVSWIVSGRVLEKGTTKPLEGVILSVNEVNSLTTISDENGNFVLKFTEKGKYTVFASLIGAEQTESRVITLEKDVLPRKLTFYLLVTTVLPEIVVNAERNPNRVSKNVIKGEELRQVAGSSGDPLKAIQSLPGIAMANGTSSAPAIRGSGPGDNYYYADSVPVGKVFHYGGISVFNGDLIETFNLYSAAFAPNYDNVTGAILDISLRNPRSDRLGGKINISLTGADFLIEGPTSGNQSFYFAARRSYFDLLIHTVERKGVILQIPNYSDYQGKYIWNVNFDNSVTLQATGAADSLKLNVASDSDLAKTQPDLAGTITAQDSSATQAIVWDTKLPSSINNKLVVGRRTSQAVNNVAAAGNVYVDSNTVFVREQMIIPLKESHDLTLATSSSSSEVGLDLNFKNTNCTQFNTGCDLSSAPLVQLEDRFHIISWDVAAQDRWRLVPRFTLVGGVRHSQENYLNQAYTEPRLGVEWEWSERTLLTAGWGRHNQIPSGQQVAPKFGNPQLAHIRALHSVIGISQKLDDDWSWKAEAYYKKFSDLVVGVNDPTVNYVNGASGSAYGTELLIKKEATDRLSGWLALTLSKSERRNDLTGETFRFEYDQPINTSLVANYKISTEWSVGSKWSYYSGRPYTPVVGTNGTYDGVRPIPVYAGINTGTLPDYHRLDLRVDRHYIFDTWKLNTYLEFNNVYGRKNIEGYDYGPNYDKKEGIEPFVLPISFGIQGEF